MTNRTNPMRRHSRFPVSWPVQYGHNACLAEGTVLDLTALGWRVAGSMPVVPGMQLTLQVSIPERSAPLCVHRATVLWVHDHEFAIEAHEMAPNDQAWVTEFLRQKLGLMWISRTTDHETSLQGGDKAPHSEIPLPQHSVPAMEDVLHRFLEIEAGSADMPGEPWRNGDSDFQETEAHTLCNRQSEKILSEAHRILARMIAINTDRVRTGRDPIVNN
ncbi:MAG: PilZ domain-containing protein [Nitrospira sp.]|nr:PilZ domain-containing protein [Nitrospira sp.]